jgi:TonB family protein
MSQVSAHLGGSKNSADRRVHARQPVRSLAYVELGEGNGGIVLNVSEGGIAVQAVMSLMSDELECVRVQLAHSTRRIEARGRITWTTGLRKTAGLELVDLSQEARSLLRDWVALEAPSREFVEEMTDPIEKSMAPVLDSPRPPVSTPIEPAEAAKKLSAAPAGAEPAESPVALEDISSFAPVTSAAAPPPNGAHAVARAPSNSPATSESKPAPHAVREIRPATQAAASDASRPVAPEREYSGLTPRPSASLPDDRFGFKTPAAPDISTASPSADRRLKLPVLVAVFAAVSVVAGWFAGHGALHGVFKKPVNDAPLQETAAASPAPLLPTRPTVSDIEVIDLSNRHWLVPMQGPLVPSQISSPHPAESSSNQLEKKNASPDSAPVVPVHRNAESIVSTDKENPPVPAPISVFARNVLPTSADSASKPAAPQADLDGQQKGGLQSGALLHRVEPAYPADAIAQRIEGTVTLYAVIDTDGTVKTLQSLDGPPALISAALAAVRQWRYSPSLLDGHPVQTERQIKIVFQLSQSQ